jgi:hypothetical protein
LAIAGDGTAYGSGVSLDQAVPIDELLANPKDYVGKKVRVDGIITGVCKNRGCWMQVSDENGKGLRIKVEDGVIVFPATSMGHRASAEGVFEAIPVKTEHAHHEGDSHGGCDKAQAAVSANKPASSKSKAAAEGKSDCAKSKSDCAKSKSATSKDAGCGAKAEGKFVYLVRGTGAVIYS